MMKRGKERGGRWGRINEGRRGEGDGERSMRERDWDDEKREGEGREE